MGLLPLSLKEKVMGTEKGIVGFLSTSDGGRSSTRLIFVIGSVWAMGLTTFLAVQGIEVPVLIAFFSAVEGVWIGLKLGQKPMENKKQQ
jgi:hypothetical protein